MGEMGKEIRRMHFSEEDIFKIKSDEEFQSLALEMYRFHYENNPVYRTFSASLKRNSGNVDTLEKIPFLPVEFFKEHKIYAAPGEPEMVFTSTGTGGLGTSHHYVASLNLYRESFLRSFRLFYGDPSEYCILGLLPSYLERTGSSLVYMVDKLIQLSGHPGSGFFLYNQEELAEVLIKLEQNHQPSLLFGVTFALLDFAEKHPVNLSSTIVMETGGMKGRRKELVREEVHEILCRRFSIEMVHSEYGMTELLSQAYSKGKGIFSAPPWMKVFVRDPYDPLNLLEPGKTGGINIIDLANIWSCPFIATGDLGLLHADGSFEIFGRMDQAEIRGCSLMVL